MQPGIDWTALVKPEYYVLLPEFIVVATMLTIMIADFYVSEKRILVWLSVAGIALAMISIPWSVTMSDAIAKGLQGSPVEAWGRMVIADNFTFFMKTVLLGIAAVVTMLSIDYVGKFLKGMFLEFYEVLLAATLGMMFMVSSRDLITIYVGLELASISSYVLAGLLRKDAKSNEAALKYFLNGALASAILLFGVSLVYGFSGTTYLPDIASAMGAHLKAGNTGMINLMVTSIIFVLAGFGFKVAAAPMHLWAPDAYEGAPTPVTGFFSVGPKGAAFGAILRVFLIGFGATRFSQDWTFVWAVLATASMFVGNLTALMQSNVKRMMAYSSIAQAGYVMVGLVAASVQGSPLGTGAVLFYVMGYALTNLGIFAVLTHMDQEGGWVNVSDFNGLAQRNPFYAWALLIFFVSLIGIPPTVGFMGKFFLFRAAVGGNYLWLALVMAVNSVISVGYYYGVVKAMFLEKSDRESLPLSSGVLVTVILTFIGVIAVGILSSPVINWAESAALFMR